MKRGFSAGFCFLTIFTAYLFVGCASSSPPTNTYESDVEALKAKFIQTDLMPESGLLAEGETPRIRQNFDDNLNGVSNEANDEANKNFCQIVGQLSESSKDFVTGKFEKDVALLAQSMRFKIAVWGKTRETSTYHNGYFIGNSYVQGWTETTEYYTAFFLVSIPRTDRDAWMLGLQVRNINYDEMSRLRRNTGVVISNVYSGSPAFMANLQPNSVITSVNGTPVTNTGDWINATRDLKAGVPLKLTVSTYGYEFPESITPKAITQEETTSDTAKELPSIGTAADFIHIKAGTFQMGFKGNPKYDWEKAATPVHEVEIDSFYMCNHEVTQEEYFNIMGTNPSYFVGENFDMKYQPVERVRWEDAIRYCNKRSEAEGLQKCYSIGSNGGGWECNWKANGYRLPTEAEWEYVARGGDRGKDEFYPGLGSEEYFRDTIAAELPEVPQKVMQKKPNNLGIYDLAGNVAEWCWDKYNGKYYSESPKANPKGARSSSESSAYVVRGGSAVREYPYSSTTLDYRVFSRGYLKKSEFKNGVGFRVVRTKMD